MNNPPRLSGLGLLFSGLFVALLIPPALPAAEGLRMGAAAVDITPPKGAPMAGYYSTRLSEGTHDPLYAKALVFEQDGAKVALVSLDLIGTTRDSVEAARREIEKLAGWRAEAVMISATHAHTGPILSGGLRADAQGAKMDVIEKYMADLPKMIAESVRLAESRLTSAKVFTGMGHEDDLSFNRRYFMKDGTVGWNPGKLNPNIVKPAGPIDPEVPVVYCESGEGKPLATYVNFAMHLDTVGGMEFSADYPFTLAKLLGQIKGPDMVTLFTIGTAGDINHVNVSNRDPQKGHGEAARIGTILAGEVLKTYARLEPVKTSAPRVRTRMVSLPLPKIEPGEVEKAREFATRYGGKNEPKFLQKVWAFKVLDVAAREGKPQEVEVQVIALGDDLAWVSLPGEIFVELGLAIKKASPFKHTIIAELANGSIGYIPTKRAYAQGNYEPISARCAEGSGERLVEEALRLLQEVRR